MSWYCVHIDHKRLSTPLNLTFRNLLTAEYRALGEPSECRVYRDYHTDGSYSYMFSPAAAEKMAVFLDFWEAFRISDPKELGHMRLIVGVEPPDLRKTGSESDDGMQDKSVEPPQTP